MGKENNYFNEIKIYNGNILNVEKIGEGKKYRKWLSLTPPKKNKPKIRRGGVRHVNPQSKLKYNQLIYKYLISIIYWS